MPLRWPARVVVVGASGLLGRAVLRHAPEGADVIAPGRDEAPLEDPAAFGGLLDRTRAEAVLLTAAWTAVDACESDPDRAFALNGDAPGRFAAAAAARGLPFVFLSTDYVFLGDATTPYAEEDPVEPRSVYARSKWRGECAVRDAAAHHVIVRTSGLYGPGGPDFVHAVGRRLHAGEARVVTDQVLSPTLVDDLALALWSMPVDRARGTLHLTASGGGTSWFAFAQRLAELDRHPMDRVQPTTTAAFGRPASRPAYSVLDCARARREYGIVLPAWDEALERFVSEWRHEWAAET